MKPGLPLSITSSNDLKAVVYEFQQYARLLSQASFKKHVDSTDAAPLPALSAAAKELLDAAAGGKPADSKILDSIIAALRQFETNLPRITITLAAPPPGTLQSTIVEWCRKNIDKNILVNFKFNSTILGGMVVSYDSHVYDWSFKRQILAARYKFPEHLRHV